MIHIPLFEKLHSEGLISEESFESVKTYNKEGLLSVHWELKTLLYLGVLLLSGGLGILIYKNIDTIGHTAILAFILIISGACFYYCFKTKQPFSFSKVVSPGIFFDYALLLGCLTFISFIAYLQFQYNVFGSRYGMATFVPMCVLFFAAYYFDHLGVLSLAITNFAAWLGLTITPMHILESNDFNSGRIILTGILAGSLLLAAAYASKAKNLKSHFEFTYTNFGIHILFISAIAALATFRSMLLLVLVIFALLVVFFYLRSMRERSFYLLFITVLYGYIGTSYAIVDLLARGSWGIGMLYLFVLYFIASGIGLVKFLMTSNKKMKAQ